MDDMAAQAALAAFRARCEVMDDVTSHSAIKASNTACAAASPSHVTCYDVDTSCYDLREPQDGEGTPGGGATALALAASALTFIARSTGAPGFLVEQETTSEEEDEEDEEAAPLVDRQRSRSLVDMQLWPGAEAAGWSITHRRNRDGRRYTYTCPEGCAYSSRQAALRSVSGQEEGQEESGREMVWSPELHAKFEAAVSALREDDVRPQPRRVLRLMNVEGLTLDSVTSHLHAYRRDDGDADRSHDRAVRPPVPRARPAVKRSAQPKKVTARAKGPKVRAPAWREGDAVEAMDLRQVWCPATVQVVEGGQLKVHYEGWGKKWDEWLDTHGDRLRREGSGVVHNSWGKEVVSIAGRRGRKRVRLAEHSRPAKAARPAVAPGPASSVRGDDWLTGLASTPPIYATAVQATAVDALEAAVLHTVAVQDEALYTSRKRPRGLAPKPKPRGLAPRSPECLEPPAGSEAVKPVAAKRRQAEAVAANEGAAVAFTSSGRVRTAPQRLDASVLAASQYGKHGAAREATTRKEAALQEEENSEEEEQEEACSTKQVVGPPPTESEGWQLHVSSSSPTGYTGVVLAQGRFRAQLALGTTVSKAGIIGTYDTAVAAAVAYARAIAAGDGGGAASPEVQLEAPAVVGNRPRRAQLKAGEGAAPAAAVGALAAEVAAVGRAEAQGVKTVAEPQPEEGLQAAEPLRPPAFALTDALRSRMRQPQRQSSMARRPCLGAVPERGTCASSWRAWWLCAAPSSQGGEVGPLGAHAQPRKLVLAAPKPAKPTNVGPSGRASCCWMHNLDARKQWAQRRSTNAPAPAQQSWRMTSRATKRAVPSEHRRPEQPPRTRP